MSTLHILFTLCIYYKQYRLLLETASTVMNGIDCYEREINLEGLISVHMVLGYIQFNQLQKYLYLNEQIYRVY